MSLLEKIEANTCSLRLQRDWLQIYTCPVPTSDFLSFVGIALLDAPQHSVLHLLYDVDVATEWVWKTAEMRVLDELEDKKGRIVYQRVTAPWPIADRDIISHSQGFKDADTSEMFIRITAMPDFLPEHDNYVRVRQLEGAWNVTPLSENRCRVVFRLHIEPAGEIPAWLANIAVIDTPYHTLNNMREMLKREKYTTPIDVPYTTSKIDINMDYHAFIKE